MNTFKLEFKKSIFNKWFWLVTAFATALALLSAAYFIQRNADMIKIWSGYGENPDLELNDNFFVNTIYRDFESVAASSFYTFIPLICVLAFGWSYGSEIKNGYIKSVITRTSKANYVISKYLATFISGGLALVIPLAVNILTLACFMAGRMPNPAHMLYYAQSIVGEAFNNIFYTAPIAYMLVMLLMHFLLGGLYATSAMTVAVFTTNRFVIALFPFVFSIVYTYLSHVLRDLYIILNAEWDPLRMFSTIGAYKLGWAMAVVLTVFLAITAVPIFWGGLKKDVF